MARKIDLTELEGAISVQGDITPITRKPVEAVTADKWQGMSVLELSRQREILTQRMYFAQRNGLLDGAKTIEQGIMLIDMLLDEKSGDGTGIGFL